MPGAFFLWALGPRLEMPNFLGTAAALALSRNQGLFSFGAEG